MRQTSQWSRQASVVNTGCTRFLIELDVLDVVKKLGLISYVTEGATNIRMMDGNVLNACGTEQLTLCRLDGPVYLLTVTASFSVVNCLATLDTDMLIGADIIAQVGGVTIPHEHPGGQVVSVKLGPGTNSGEGCCC